MIEPQRLLDDPELGDEARELLRALPVPTEPTAAKTAALAAQLTALAGSPAAPALPVAKTALWLKLSFVVGAVGLAAVSLYLLRSPKPPQTQPQATAAAVASVVPAVASSEIPSPTPSVDTSAEPTPAASATAAMPAPSARTPRDTLAAEEALLEQARKTAASSPSRALALLEQYKRQFPRGQLSAERMFLSADVLSRLGNQPAAQRERDALVRAFPRSVYAAQVKANAAH